MTKYNTALLLTCTLIGSNSLAFNSEEHKLISDLGAEMVVIHDGIELPSSVTKSPDIDYLNFLKEAKKFAVGFDTNNPREDYNKNMHGVQDNAFWNMLSRINVDKYGLFRQSVANKSMWIPTLSEVPFSILKVDAYANNTPEAFTFGELVALYGDFRRTTYCDTNVRCYLTNFNIDSMKFDYANYPAYAPTPISPTTYLRYIGSGLEPPNGGAGNQFSNTAGEAEVNQIGWWGDDLIRLANTNDWHFSSVGNAMYIGLHRNALLYVHKAISDPKYWVAALHYEANALHSLTDFFAFGHEVTNRDETAYGMLKDKGLDNKAPILWQEHMIKMGSGHRNVSNGNVSLTGDLPSINHIMDVRNDFLASNRGKYGIKAKGEKDYHDYFNGTGAKVVNLNGDTFNVKGDANLHALLETDKEPIKKAVASSIQSLFDAYIAMTNGISVEEIAAKGSSYFRALEYIPIYIDNDKNGYFLGRYVRSAEAIMDIVGNRDTVKSEVSSCIIPYLSGKDWGWPTVHTSKCTELTRYFPSAYIYHSNWLASGGRDKDAPGNHPIKFEVTYPSRVIIDLESDDADTYLYLLGGEETLQVNDDYAGGTNSRIDIELPIGVYSIVPGTFSELKSGKYKITLNNITER